MAGQCSSHSSQLRVWENYRKESGVKNNLVSRWVFIFFVFGMELLNPRQDSESILIFMSFHAGMEPTLQRWDSLKQALLVKNGVHLGNM